MNKTFVTELENRAQRSRATAVKLHCIQCMGGEAATRADIRDCTATGCALYTWRPYRGTKSEGTP
jgi:hypothetical protein